MKKLYSSFFLISCIACLLVSYVASAQLVANFTMDHQAGCAPLIVHFTSTSTGATSYSWDLGNTTTSTLQNPSTSYLTPGTYSVKLTASNATGSNTKILTITVYSPPLVNFSVPTTVCAGSPLNFTNLTQPGVPGPVTYNWDFGDGGSSTAQNPTHTYTTPANYTVSLLATNSQGCDSLLIKTAIVHVLAHPTAQFSANTLYFCKAPATVQFTDQSAGSGPFTYSWSFGDNGTSTAPNPVHTYQTTGSFTVTLTVTDANGCSDTYSQTSYITVGGPTAAFTPPTGCARSLITFTNTSANSNIQSYWSFGDGSIGAGSPTVHTYANGGTYNVRLVIDDGTCKDTVTHLVTILPGPVIGFTANPTAPCTAPATIQFSSTTPPGSSYSWYFSDGGTSNAANPSHTFNTYSLNTAVLTVTGTNGCQTSDTQNVNTYDLHAVAIGIDTSGCLPLTTQFFAHDSTNVPGPSTNYPYPITSYTWHFGDGSPVSTQQNPSHTYTVAGKYTPYVTITTSNGCTVTDSVHVATAAVPPLTMTATPTHICADQYVYFHATPIDGAYYTWYFGDASSSPVTILNDSVEIRQYTSPGIFYPYVIVTLNGCNDTVTIFNITITVDPSKAAFLTHYHCDTLTKVNFTNTSIGSNTTYNWIFGDGTTSTQTSPTHIFPALGVYTTLLIAYNATTGCTDTAISFVHLHNIQPTFTADDTAICMNEKVTFTATYSGAGFATDFHWSVDGISLPGGGVQPIAIDSFYIKGWHNVSVAITDDHNCSYTVTKNHYILVARPVDSFAMSPLQGCTPLTVQFTDKSKDEQGAYIVNRSWWFGDGTSMSNTPGTIAHTFNNNGPFYPTEVVVDNIGCTDTFSYGPVNAFKPTASFTASTIFPCKNIPFTLNNTSTSTVTSYWTFGDNTSSAATSPTHTYSQNGTYSVSLKVTDAHGCSDSITQNAYLNVAGPTAAFNMSDSTSICAPLVEHFTNTSLNATSYAWSFGNNGSSTITNPSTNYITPGNYLVKLIVTDTHGCTDTITHHLKVYGYAGTFTYTPLIGCSPLTVQFTANITNVPHITWDFSDGNVSPTTSAVTATHTYTVPGAYVPKLILSDSTGCAASSVGTDTIKVDGIIGGFTTIPYPVCIYDTVKFLDTSKSLFSQITSRKWTFSTGSTSSLASPTYYFSNTSTLGVNLVVVNSNGCRDTITGNVTVHPLPVITVSSDTVICVHDSATLTASGAISYVWSPTSTLGCPLCASTHAAPISATTYFVKGKDGFGCLSVDSVKVKLKTKTTDIVGMGGEICKGQYIGLKDSGAQTYVWYPATGLSNSHIGNPIASPTATTTYMVIATQGSCIPDTNYVVVTVHPLPIIKATVGANRIIAGSTTDILATGAGIVSYFWEPSNLVDCDSCSRVLAKLTQTTTFTVTGTTQFGCEDSDKVTVEVLCDKSQLFIPNTFTPNGDGQNDVFYPRGVGLRVINSFRIYNRWGELVFERRGIQLNDESQAWDGTIGGKLPAPDVYVYVVQATCDNGSPINWKGDVTLIR